MLRTIVLGTFALSLAIASVGCASPSSSTDDIETGSEAVTAGAEINVKNWLTHPKIVAVRKDVNEIDKAARTKKFKVARKDDLCEGTGEASREKVTDQKGNIRRLTLEAGSDDSFQTDTVYYNDNGSLRFVFLRGSDVFGRARETRVYFDQDGGRLFQVIREANEVHEPGTFEPDLSKAPWTLEAEDGISGTAELFANPAKTFDDPADCTQ